MRLQTPSLESDGNHESFSASDEDQNEDEVFTNTTAPTVIDRSSLSVTSQCMQAPQVSSTSEYFSEGSTLVDTCSDSTQ